MSAVSRAIEMQEYKDRFIAGKVMRDCCTGENLKMWTRAMSDPIDVSGECMFMGSKFQFNLEIKERNKTDRQLQQYPHAELRVDKFKRMIDKTENGVNLLYMVLLNEKTCYLYNLTNINWKKVTTFDWEVKKTEMAYNSDRKVYPIYQIPFSLAFLTMDCTKYYQEYYKNYGD